MAGLCYCRSGKEFLACCGDPGPNRKPPVGLHIYNGLFSKTDCKKLVRLANAQSGEWLTLQDEQRSRELGEVVQKRDPNRVAQAVEMQQHAQKLISWVNQAVVQCVEPAVGTRVEFFEVPQLLRYGRGGLYKSHADAENFNADTGRWERCFDRDVSLLVYLNDKYKGGGLHFGSLNYTYQPRAGDVVFFPSGHRYVHESQPITSGVKYALVSWMAVEGSERVGVPDTIRIPPQRG